MGEVNLPLQRIYIENVKIIKTEIRAMAVEM
jgi:hypothetical protein